MMESASGTGRGSRRTELTMENNAVLAAMQMVRVRTTIAVKRTSLRAERKPNRKSLSRDFMLGRSPPEIWYGGAEGQVPGNVASQHFVFLDVAHFVDDTLEHAFYGFGAQRALVIH